ncbi:SRPBCC domain-containing protein [Echinicola jeungdonensis]|uniref:SRPBCC domain-containing protein n=1 Tax=Echinicola jeungdonensis TaxID=709343 RepID=A0ABV5J431_9BACT|nr:SRPBCC domain-containing protein [Echinicola jeungdonensis]MDN3670698.1 SRPBCC domain-containing protein [Echinicola jeungdonensis]
MERQKFKILINAKPEKVWKILWDDATYRQWTKVFSEGSRAESDWKEGSKILFLDGKGNGMVSKIEKLIPNKFMSFIHMGTIHEGKEDMSNKGEENWNGAIENYTLIAKNNQTELTVEMDIDHEYKEFFEETFPKAIQKVKELAEKEPAVSH